MKKQWRSCLDRNQSIFFHVMEVVTGCLNTIFSCASHLPQYKLRDIEAVALLPRQEPEHRYPGDEGHSWSFEYMVFFLRFCRKTNLGGQKHWRSFLGRNVGGHNGSFEHTFLLSCAFAAKLIDYNLQLFCGQTKQSVRCLHCGATSIKYQVIL